ncbi:hypothetical protein ADK55_18575 [Streptomyces sp. WM4235]|uniref:hypothetical protein n=1 Tax=Streptomyces sp. WM4235 TaxID=1415551 RepID=UPI0006AFB023|nr:hypothetical protein [Streptomyces sp. WM4235]KOU50549.1 hypothetical protein ADK55_18575 [Streptomyces sp. WM4235]
MTPAELRAAIARDCPHRLDDYDRHAAAFEARGWPLGLAFAEFWRQEHAISSRPRVEERIDRLYRAAQRSRFVWRARRLMTKASRIRGKILEGLK